MPGDTILVHLIDKVPLGITRQCRLTKMGVLTEVGGGLNIKIGEVAASTARHQNFASRFLAIINQQNAATRLSGHCGTKHPCGSCANNNGIKLFHDKLPTMLKGMDCK